MTRPQICDNPTLAAAPTLTPDLFAKDSTMIRSSWQVMRVLLLLVLWTADHANAQAVSRAPAGERFAEAISASRSSLAEHTQAQLPGFSIAVGVDGKVVWAEGFGWADLEQQVPVTSLTRFRIGSVSKPITAFAIGLLVADGALDLDAPVQEYVASFPDKDHPISTRLAAGHLAGIRHYSGNEFLSATYYPNVVSGLAVFQDDPLLSVPGTEFSYSSYGWNLVSAVIESAAEQEFLSYMQEQVFDRLGMIHTVADYNHHIIPQRARPYQRNQDLTFRNAPYVDNSYKWAGGGFLSTPEDMVRFGLAHLDGVSLDPDIVDLLFTSQKTTDGQSTGYGIGWRSSTQGGQRVVGHGGGSVGGSTNLALYPESGIVVAMVSNLSSAQLPNAHAIARRFAAARTP